MKILLVLTLTGLYIAGVCASSSEENSTETFSPKERLRKELARELHRASRNGITSICPRELSPEQIVFGNEKIEEFVECGNATIDLFINKLDDNVNFNDVKSPEQAIRVFAEPVCEIFDDIFRCIGEIGPVIDLCLDEREKIFKDKLFAIVPLLHQTVCLRNGAHIVEIVEHADGRRCVEEAFLAIADIGFIELFDSESTELFGDPIVCQRFNTVLQQIYIKIGECSLGVLEKVKDMLGFFCDGTKCNRYVPDLQCY